MGPRQELDVEATVEAYARSGQLIPTFASAPEQWFDLTFVVDRSPGMRVWRETVDELTAAVGRLGAFRTLQICELRFDIDGNPVTPSRLRSADGRRLVVVVSDCVAEAWRQPEVWQLLRAWAGSTPTALLNPLPTRLWRGTGLNLPTVRVVPKVPGQYGTRLPHDPPPLLDLGTGNGDDTWLPVPVLALSAHSLARWSRSLMRSDPAGCSAVLMPPVGAYPDATAEPAARPLPPGDLARGFLRTAGPAAIRLAVLCSVFDRPSLSLLHVVRGELVPEARIADVAEVVNSGLFELPAQGRGVELSMPRAAQEVLQQRLAVHELWRVHEAVERHIASGELGPGSIRSVASDPAAMGELAADRAAFARASRQTLLLLGVPPEADGGVCGLPPGPAPYIGSEELADTLERLLRGDSPRMCITADADLPGAGRTALALHVAHRVRDHFPDGQVFLDLRGSTRYPVDQDAALHLLLQALGHPADAIPRTSRKLIGAVRDALRGQRVLVVLDDVRDADFVSALLDHGPGCGWLLTMPDPMRVPPEFVNGQLRPLPLEDACALVIATAGRPFESDEQRALASLLSQVDHLIPLSVRLVGTWLSRPRSASAWTKLHELVSRDPGSAPTPDPLLSIALEVLHSASRPDALILTATPTGLLTVPEAAALLRLGQDEARKVLELLLSAGLLEQREAGTYRFHPVVHAQFAFPVNVHGPRSVRALLAVHRSASEAAYGAERPDSRFADHLRATEPQGAQVLPGPSMQPQSQPLPVSWMANALAHVHAVHEGLDESLLCEAAAILLMLQDEGATALHRSLYERAATAVSAPRRAEAAGRRRALTALAYAHRAGGRPARCGEALAELRDGDAGNDGPLEPHICLLAGEVAMKDGHYEEAWQHFDAACRGFTVWPDPYAGAEAHLALARAELATGRADGAVELAEAVARAYPVPPADSDADIPLAWRAMAVLEQAYGRAGRTEQALTVQRGAVAHFRARGMRVPAGSALRRAAESLLTLGRLREAVSTAQEALSWFDDPGAVRERAVALTVRGKALLGLRAVDDARAAFEQAAALVRPYDGEEAARLVETSRALGTRTVVAVALDGGGSRDRLRECLLDVLRGHEVVAEEPERASGSCLFFVDPAAPVRDLIDALVRELPSRLEDAGLEGSARIAVDVGVLAPGRGHGRQEKVVRSALGMVASQPFRALAERITAHPAVCVPPWVFETLVTGDDEWPFDAGFTVSTIERGIGTHAFVFVPPTRPQIPDDPELAALVDAWHSRDRSGTRLSSLLRECIDRVLDMSTTGRYDVRQLRPGEHALLAGEVERAVRGEFRLGLGRKADVEFTLPGKGAQVELELKLSLSGRWKFGREAVGTLAALIHVDEARSLWSLGFLRVHDRLLLHAVDRDARKALSRAATSDSVVWLHRDELLPENTLLHLDEQDRVEVLALQSGLLRVRELLRRAHGRFIPRSVLVHVYGGPSTNVHRRIREAGESLREEGVLVLAADPEGRRLSRAMGYRAPSRDEYLSLRLTHLRPHHGDRPSIVADGVGWTVADPGDPGLPLPPRGRLRAR
ncbi:NaeI family type II restriction endonuclease [Streptomyces gardneri]|uniref:NaeI family type II restriction endonuclease n=1 Tax=Streptomyces gardneri TaxID=66892 RepID=UPI0035DB4DCF